MTTTDNLTFISMFFLGLLGSGHCLGMCGPLVVALPGRFGNWLAHLAYHTGRILTYTMIGALLGGAGSGFTTSAALASEPAMSGVLRLQLIMSAVAAVFLLIFGLNRLGLLSEPAWLSSANPGQIPGLGRFMQRTLQAQRLRLVVVLHLGLILGLLPCGLSYAAFARTLASGGSLNGGVLAFGFGLGTLPALLALGTSAGQVFRRYRQQAEMLAGLIMIAMGLLLVKNIGVVLF